MWNALRDACEILAPGWVGPPGGAPLVQCFLTGLEERGDERVLILDPVAGPLEAGRVQVDVLAAGAHLHLRGTVEATPGGRVAVAVRRPPVVRPPRARRLVPAPHPSVASFIPEGLGLGRCHLPVLDIGARGVSVQSRVPLAVGTPLRDLVVVSRATQLRHAEGTVQSCTALLLAGGRTAWRCGIALRAPGPGRPAPGTEDAELSDPERVRTILWGLVDLQSDVLLHVSTREVRGTMHAGHGSRDALPALDVRLEDPEAPLPAGVAQVATNLFGSGYHFVARMSRASPGHVTLTPSGFLRQVFRREDTRVDLAHQAEASVLWRHPLDPVEHQHRLLDLGVEGFGMEADAQAFALWPGLPLRDVCIRVPGLAFAAEHAEVRVTSGKRVGVRMAPLSIRDAERLRLMLVLRSNPAIQFHDGEDLDAILRFHRRVKLLEPPMEENLQHGLAETRRTWALAHQHAEGLMRTALGRRDREVTASLTLVRAYDTSWALQHAAVQHPTAQPTPGTLHGALSSLVHPRPDGEFLFGYLADDVPSQHALMQAFLNTASTPEHRGSQVFHVLAGRAQTGGPTRAEGVRRITPATEALVENAARRVLDPVCAQALALKAGQLTLPESRAAFARGGLVRGRDALGVWRGGQCVAILLREWASPGLCLSSMLNAAMLLPVCQEADPDGRATASLLRMALTLPLHGEPPWRLVLVPVPWDVNRAAPAGLARVAGCTLFAFHRHGQREYHHYVASRYGLLHARLRGQRGDGG